MDAYSEQQPPPYTKYASISTNQNAGSGHDVSEAPGDAHCNIGRERARRRWITVELIVVLVAASYGGLATLKGQYIRYRVVLDLANGSMGNSSLDDLCSVNGTSDIENAIQQETSKWNIYLGTASSLPGILVTLLLGTMSEHYGRRLAILVPCFGFLLQCAISLFIVYLSLPLSVFFLSDVIAGCSGGLSLFMAGCFSYIADITTEKTRMIRIVIVEILIFVGIGITQIGLGYMINILGFAKSLWVPFAALMASIVNAAVPALLPETVSPSQEEKQRSVKDVLSDVVLLFTTKKENRRSILACFIAIILLIAVVTQGSIAITTLYGQGQPFCWQSITIGFFVTSSLVIPGIGTVIGAGVFPRCKLAYLGIIQIANCSGLANMIAMSVTFIIQSSVLIFSSTFLGIFKLLGLPVIRTFLSTIVEKHEHGALFASLGVLDGLSMFLSPLLINGIYAATVDILSTLVFFVMSGMMLVSITLTGILQCRGVGRNDGNNSPLLINTAHDENGHAPLLEDE